MLREWSDLPNEHDRQTTLKLFNELEQLMSRVAEVESELGRLTGRPGGARLRAGPDLAGLLLAARKERDKMFPRIFGEPAWDILLSLAALKPSQPYLAASSVSYEAAVPPTTTLRYLALLETAGLVERSMHPSDARIVLVRLSDSGRERLQHLLEKWPLAILIATAPLALLVKHFFP